MLGVNPYEYATLPARRHRHVATDEKRQAAKHLLLAERGLDGDKLSDAIGEVLVVCHTHNSSEPSNAQPVGDTRRSWKTAPMTVIRATVLQTPRPEALEVLTDALINVGADGRIISVSPADGSSQQMQEMGPQESAAVIDLGPSTVLIPGLIDTHLHAPQWPQRATGLDLPLESWLFEHTFPLEARFADAAYAEQVWDAMVPHLLRNGTTTAVYYSSIHEPATTALAAACVQHGQRAFVGRVAMDHPDGTPTWYRDASAGEAIDASHRSLEAIAAIGGDLVRPIITPRFIPACSDDLLRGLGQLATETGALVQTHCSESDWQHANVAERCGRSDAEALIDFGLARDHSVLAHATHLSGTDRSALAAVGAGIAHCPLSNSYFANAVFPARRALDAGLRVGLGSDIAGGPEASMLAQCGHAVTASRMLEDGVDVTNPDRATPDSRLDIIGAFWLATVGGAELLGIDAGLIAPGRHFDAVAVNIGSDGDTGIDPDLDDWPRRFEKIVRAARRHDITSVWVGGVDVTPPAKK